MLKKVSRALLLLSLVAAPLRAEVVRVEVTSRADLLGGQTFGAAGGYEKIIGKIYFAVDPSLPANRIVTDIDKAPRNADGKVEFSSDFYIIKPKRSEQGNGAVLYEVSNRGGKGMLGFFNHAAGNVDPTTAEQFGDGFLMRQGFTLLWLGWQFDVPQNPGLVRAYVPIATDNGKAIRGIVRSDFELTDIAADASLADRNHIPYLVADPSAAENVMTVRDSREGERRAVPKGEWGFGRMENGQIVPDRGRVYLKGGFKPFKVYEVVYTSENPPVVGLGSAAIRDTISMLKSGKASSAMSALAVTPGAIDRALAFGVSQSGRFLRTYLYFGFNRDENEKRVFDGVIPHVAGGGIGFFNHRFAQPSRDGHPFINFFYPVDIFPFTDVAQTDPDTGVTDGLLTHAGYTADQLPKIFYTNSEYEYWGRSASQIHTTVDGKSDIPLMDNVRIYLMAAGQHGPAAFPPVKTLGQQLSNPLDYRWGMKALLLGMDRWVRDGTAPPPSKYPKIADGTLVPAASLKFPKVAGVITTTNLHAAYHADYGPQFRTAGVITVEPPKIGKPFPLLVPQDDADGNGLAGVRMPELAVPLATYTGWNLFNEKSGPSGVLSSMQGSYIPFARNDIERNRTADPRPSIEERYRNKDQYVGLVTKAALEMIDQHYLLPEDLAEIVRNAGRHWDLRSTMGSSAGAQR